jgi:hypothetical protein
MAKLIKFVVNHKETIKMAVSRSKLNDMYERVFACLDAEFADLPADSGGKIAADGLRDAYDIINQKGSAQAGFGGSAQAGTGQRTTARFNIREYRTRLAETANIVARKKPGFNSNFPPPSGETDDQLITNTHAVVAKAIEMKADFLLRGLTLAYLQSGTELIEAFETALNTTNEALSHRGAAVGSKKSAYAQADEFFDELDIYIRNQYRDQPDKLNAWRNASHVERAAKKNDDEENPPPTT